MAVPETPVQSTSRQASWIARNGTFLSHWIRSGSSVSAVATGPAVPVTLASGT